MDLNISIIIILMVVSFLCETIDSSLGMGYGTTLGPILILFGFSPIIVVPAILISELITGILAGILHHRHGNVDLSKNSIYLKIALLLTGFGMIGGVSAGFVVLNIPQVYIKIYIGFMVISMGILVYLFRERRIRFNWLKISLLALIASFNKGMSGGGYGPVMTSGQILSGVPSKSSVGITSFAEAASCFAALLVYIFGQDKADFRLALPLAVGAIASVPLAVRIVKRINEEKFVIIVGIVTICLGLLTLIRVFCF